MYVPNLFVEDDPAELAALMRAASFATLITSSPDGPAGAPTATHLPLLFDDAETTPGNPHGRLLGHVAAANGHHAAFDGEREALAVFSGPHAYISPSWYETPNMVPTWNYAAVHAYGRPRVIADPDDVMALLARLTGTYESDATGNWRLDDQDQTIMRGMIKGIVAFEMPIERIEGKWKMSQNRKPNDAKAAAKGLRALGGPDTAAVADEMERRLRGG
jgi:transcriptional regulator